jgi:hypothetical protein
VMWSTWEDTKYSSAYVHATASIPKLGREYGDGNDQKYSPEQAEPQPL